MRTAADKCVMPSDIATDKDVYSAPGEVISGHMAPEEIAARYGPPVKRENVELTAPRLHWAIRKFSGWEAAARWLHVEVSHLAAQLLEHKIKPPAEWGQVPKVAKTDSPAPEKPDPAIPNEECRTDKPEPQTTRQTAVKWAPRERLCTDEWVLQLSDSGLLTNNAFARQFFVADRQTVCNVRVGVVDGRIVIAPCGTHERDAYTVNVNTRGAGRIGGKKQPVKWLRGEGFTGRWYVVVWNQEMSWWETAGMLG